MKELSEKEGMGWVRRESLQDRKLVFRLWGWGQRIGSFRTGVSCRRWERLCSSESGEEEGGRCRVPGRGWQTLGWEVPEWALGVELHMCVSGLYWTPWDLIPNTPWANPFSSWGISTSLSQKYKVCPEEYVSDLSVLTDSFQMDGVYKPLRNYEKG